MILPPMSRFRAHSLALATVCALAWAGTAAAVPSNVQLTSAANDPTPAFSWTGDSLASFDWELTGAGGTRIGSAAVPFTEVSPAVADGAWSFRVREVVFGTPGEWSGSVGFTIDTVAPGIVIRTPTPGQAVQSGAVIVADYECTGGAVLCQSGVADGQPIPTIRAGTRTFTVQTRDAAGNAAQQTVSWRVVDSVAPSVVALRSPLGGVVLGTARPPFSWTAASDAQGIDRYEVVVNGFVRARVGRNLTWTPTTNFTSGAYTWAVRALDPSGNVSTSPIASFSIDLSAPPPPLLTAGPPDPTTDSTPTFAWSGTGPNYTYSLLRGGGGPPVVRATTTRGTSVTLGALADGEYVFRVSQTNAFNRASPDTEAVFAVDTVAPAAPVVTSAPPPTSTGGAPSFSWTPAEPGGTFTWRIEAAGAVVQQAEAVVPEITAGPLVPGSYAFVVHQVDDAGNVGAASSASSFEVTAVAPAVGSVAIAPTPTRRARPATLTPKRLRPAAGARIKGKSVTLRWQSGPAGTRLYNLQIFRITSTNRVKKILSSFPRKTEFTVPRVRLKGGSRYVWRVWPYLGDMKLAKRPVGVSFFDVVKRTGAVKK